MSERYCCECGAGIPGNAKFCWKCGSAAVGPLISEEDPGSSNRESTLEPAVPSPPEEPTQQVVTQIVPAGTPQAPQPEAQASQPEASTSSTKPEVFCPMCGGENQDGFSFCRSCGHALQEFPWASSAESAPVPSQAPGTPTCQMNIPDIKDRHGCLTTWLLLMIIANAAYAVLFLLWSNIFDEELDMPTWIIYLCVAIYIINIVCAIALFRWKKWGFYVLLSLCTVGFVLSLVVGDIRSAVMGFVPALVLYGVLHIGDGNKGWDQLE
jgi:hypothetical protein